jgi:XTP/dITP diphosphohydrolase
VSGPPDKIVLASGNPGKLREIAKLLEDLQIEVVPQSVFGVSEAIEDGSTFAENSLIKARHASEATGLAAIADDSGLAVDVLGGRPGVYSARYAGPGATDDQNIDKLLAELVNIPADARTAAFHCVATFVSPDGTPPLQAEGIWRGSILGARQGDGGFGYDPVFLDPASGKSSAQLSPKQKGARSHRGQALRQLVDQIRQRYA